MKTSASKPFTESDSACGWVPLLSSGKTFLGGYRYHAIAYRTECAQIVVQQRLTGAASLASKQVVLKIAEWRTKLLQACIQPVRIALHDLAVHTHLKCWQYHSVLLIDTQASSTQKPTHLRKALQVLGCSMLSTRAEAARSQAAICGDCWCLRGCLGRSPHMKMMSFKIHRLVAFGGA